jgi:hypothetical protein
MARFLFSLLVLVVSGSGFAGEITSIAGIECAKGTTTISVNLFQPGPTDVQNAAYSVQIKNGSKSLMLIAKGKCFFALGVDPHVFTCFDEFGAQAQNMISTNLFGANGPGYFLRMWGSQPHSPNGDPSGDPLTADLANELGIGPLDASGTAVWSVLYSHTVVSTNDGFNSYCVLKNENPPSHAH